MPVVGMLGWVQRMSRSVSEMDFVEPRFRKRFSYEMS
jgi:hypothetical protein